MRFNLTKKSIALLVVMLLTLIKYINVDRSAKELAGGVLWKGEWYIQSNAEYAGEFDFLGRTTEGGFIFSTKRNDPELSCIVVRNLLDQSLYIRENVKDIKNACP